VAKFSFSQLETALGCERRWYYEKIEKRARPDNVYFAAGNYLHSRAELRLLGQDTTVTPGKLVKPELLKHLDLAYAQLEAKVLSKIVARPGSIESRFSTPDWSGKIDCVADSGPAEWELSFPLVLDWKTCHTRRFMQRKPADSPQLALYAKEAGTLAAAFVECDLFPPYEIRVLGATFTPEILEWWGRWLEAQRRALLSRGEDINNYRLASAGDPLCSVRFCPHYQYCAGGNNQKESK
jgi:PD-(D/E)XK nuclease superfamily protein